MTAESSGPGTLGALERDALECTRCPLAATRTQVVFGAGNPNADLMFVGEAPGFHEDLQGIPFVGASGDLLTRLIEEMGLSRDRVYIANVVKCRPPDNRDPGRAEIESCRPWLEGQLEYIMPRVVVTLGNFATKLLLDTKEGITRVRGKEYPWKGGSVIVPTYHPAAVLRGRGGALAEMRADFALVKRALRRLPSDSSPEATGA